MAERGLLDTSVVIDHDLVDAGLLSEETLVSAITFAELAAGPHATGDEDERARRQDRLQWAIATWDPIPFDADAARAFGRVYAAARSSGRTGRSRIADLQIAAVAVANGLPLYTRNPDDFVGLGSVITVVSV